MKLSRKFFMVAVSIHTLLPIIVGIAMFLGFVVIAIATQYSPRSGSVVLDIFSIGAVGFLGVGFFVFQFPPTLVTAIVLTFLAPRLLQLSSLLYIVVCIVIGGGASAFWFSHNPQGLHGLGGMLAFSSSVGFLFSGLCVASLKRL